MCMISDVARLSVIVESEEEKKHGIYFGSPKN